MSNNLLKSRKPRKDALYSREEMEILNKHKDEYREQTTKELRANVIKTKILVDLFNFWLDRGRAPTNEEDSVGQMKELAGWVRNNWRPHSTTQESRTNVKVTAINVVWQTCKPAVEDKLKDILGVDELDSRHPGYFQQRTAACKQVLEEMTERERTEIARIVENRRVQGNPESIRRDRAEKYREKNLQTWSKERWLDMGLATVIFTVHTDQQGRLVADVHDEVLPNMGLHGRPFTDKYEDKVVEMKRSFLDFMKSVRHRAAEDRNATARIGPSIAGDQAVQDGMAVLVGTENLAGPAGPAMDHTSSDLEVKMTSDGYPIIPKAALDTRVSKKQSEDILRAYLTQHYYLACRGKKRARVPFAAIQKDTPAFVPAQYRPVNVILKDPRNMTLHHVLAVLRHCYDWQEAIGAPAAFRFSLYLGRNRKPLFASYPDARPQSSAPGKHSSKRKGKQKATNDLDGLLAMPQNEHLVVPVPSQPTRTNSDQAGTSERPSPCQPGSNQIRAALADVTRDLVTVGMGEMMKLKDLGCDTLYGPINGPNEGLPQYQVPRYWCDRLKENNQSIRYPPSAMVGSTVDPGPSQPARPYSRPRPVRPPDVQMDRVPEPVIDPSLGPTSGQPVVDQVQLEERSGNIRAGSGDHPVELAGTATGRSDEDARPKKRGRVIESPQRRPVTRSSKHRKVMTSDALAAKEASRLMPSTKRHTRRK